MIVIGLGARKGATVEEFEAIVDELLDAQNFTRDHLSMISSLYRDELASVIAQTANRLGVQMSLLPIATLQEEAGRCQTHSDRSMEATGVPSVCEAAALAALGPNARLIAPRTCHERVTAAMAIEIVKDPITGKMR